MKWTRNFRVLSGCFVFVGASAFADGAPSTPTPPRATISVADVIRQTVIGDPGSLTWSERSRSTAAFSPDGKRVAVVVTRGNLEENTNDAELLVYDVARLMERPLPTVLARFGSATRYPPLAQVRWLADGETLVFAATEGGANTQIYRVNVRTRELTPLTQAPTPLEWYDITPSGRWLVTANQPPRTPPRANAECIRSGCLVTAETLHAAEQGVAEISATLAIHDLHSGRVRSLSAIETADPDLIDCRDDLSGGIAPDGRFGVRLCKLRAHTWPKWWADYTVTPDWRRGVTQGANGTLRQWILIDFSAGTSTRLTDAPFQVANLAQPLWIDGGTRLVLAGALESLANAEPEERARRASRYSILAIDPATRQTQRIAWLGANEKRVLSTAWDDTTQSLTVQTQDADRNTLPARTFRRTGQGWVEQKAPAAASAASQRVSLVIEEGLNEPPVLVAVDQKSRARTVVLDPNPWLSERSLGRVEATAWRSKDGREWRGGIYFPPGYVAGQRYPAVLQTHGFDPERFSLNGIARNFVAQPLASRGMIVLQIAENTRGASEREEWAAVQSGYESAVDHLDHLGLIERTRVGIQGWSRTGPYVGYTLTQSSYPFAAAALTESGDFGWWWYLANGARRGESAYGEPPFGAGLDVWRKMSPTFNLERVRTPMLMWEATSVAGLWDWYAGLRRLGKPVEYWFFPDGTHDAFKVGERLRAGNLLVDWFAFWLKDQADPDDLKSAQYARWRKLREQQDADSSGHARPSLTNPPDAYSRAP